MKYLTTAFVVFFLSFVVHAQRVYFVYIQTENKQPFFLTLNETIHGSTPSGYLILSKLRDSTYRFSIGFPNNIAPEQKFTLTINRKDHGYLLKDFGAKGWGLFDLQTMAVQMSATLLPVSSVDFAALRTTVDPFTALLSRATDDPSLLQRIVIPRPESKKPDMVKTDEPNKKPVDEKPEVKKDMDVSKVTPVNNKEAPTDKKENEKAKVEQVELKNEITEKSPGKKEEEKSIVTKDTPSKIGESVAPDIKIIEEKTEVQYKRSKVVKRSESSITEGFGLVYIDEEMEGQKDTIRIMIANDNRSSTGNDVKVQPRQEKKFLDIDDRQILKDTALTEKKENTPPVVAPILKTGRSNSCKQAATESDFFKLRKRMAAQSKEDNMIDEAKKYFRLKCYTTEQVKNLSALFLTNGGKYKFFDSAYQHVSDLENFPSLETEIKDEYFIKRFKAIIY